MNPVLLGAIALGSVPVQPTVETNTLWANLDRDFAALAQSTAAEKRGVEVGAYLKTAIRSSNDIQVNGEDEGGLKINFARLEFKGKIGRFELIASIDGANNDVEIKDFHARIDLGGKIFGKVGQYRTPFIFSGVASDTKEIFYDRSTQGSRWSGREPGVALEANYGKFAWWLSLQNGGDQAGEKHLLIGKVAAGVLGDVIMPKQTGGFGTNASPAVTIGVGYANDSSAASATDTSREATAVSAEVVAVMGRIFFLTEIVNYDEDFVRDIDTGTAGNQNSVLNGQAASSAAANVADTSPWGATLGFMVTEHDEVAVRWENFNDSGVANEHSTERYWLGYTRFIEGHAAKVQVNWMQSHSQGPNGEDDTVDEFLVGLIVQI